MHLGLSILTIAYRQQENGGRSEGFKKNFDTREQEGVEFYYFVEKNFVKMSLTYPDKGRKEHLAFPLSVTADELMQSDWYWLKDKKELGDE